MRRGANGGLIAIAGYDASERHAALRGVQCLPNRHSGQAFRLWRIDPCGGWFGWRDGRFFDEALRILPERLIEGELAGRVNSVDLAIVHLIRGHEADPGMVMVPVVPIEEAAAETPGVLDATEAFREPRLIFQRLEVALGERVIVRGVWPIMRTGDAEVAEQQHGGLGFHRSTAIGMKGQLAWGHMVFRYGIVEQNFEQHSAFRIHDTPADHAAAVDVKDHIKIEVAPFGRTFQFGDVPGPDLIWTFRQKFRLLINRMAQLGAAFPDLMVFVQKTIHGPDGAVVVTFIQQRGVNFRRRLIGEAPRVQQIEYRLLLRGGQRSCRSRPWPRDRWRRAQPYPAAHHAGA